eukprot:gnl/Dysnectes_brevis/7640_a13011_268.p1 GENE.gnl/Dysnectes_brevis/7640_a13011_268~~gnl/Dysnectes_brevis/7640_a13011_268.p1  ORF type:complete len:309 (+),score=63.39 gnl/Dysnectes_brevis/7640_a13011_268:252-1178(+)
MIESTSVLTHQESWHHWVCLIFLIPLFTFLRLIITFIIRRLFVSLGYKHDICVKIADSCYYFLQYSLTFIMSFCIMKDMGLVTSCAPLWEHLLAIETADGFRTQYHKLYMVEAASYIVSLLFILSDSRKDFSDFKVMVFHHFLTLALLVGSYILRFYPWGIMVLATHDFSDIWLELSKVINYTVGEPTSAVTFAIFSLSFLLIRCIYYPLFTVLPSSFGECSRYLEGKGGECRYFLQRWPMVTGMWAIWVLDVYWFRLIVLMVIGIVRGEVRGDIRDGEEKASGRGGVNRLTGEEHEEQGSVADVVVG